MYQSDACIRKYQCQRHRLRCIGIVRAMVITVLWNSRKSHSDSKAGTKCLGLTHRQRTMSIMRPEQQTAPASIFAIAIGGIFLQYFFFPFRPAMQTHRSCANTGTFVRLLIPVVVLRLAIGVLDYIWPDSEDTPPQRIPRFEQRPPPRAASLTPTHLPPFVHDVKDATSGDQELSLERLQ
jgi:hypothetical protein